MPAKLTPEERKARIRAALARSEEKPGAVENAIKYKPEPVVQEQTHPVVQQQQVVAEPTTPAVADKPKEPAPITEETIARGVSQRRRGGMNKEPNYQLHVLMALTVAFLVQGLATGWGTVKTAFAKTTGTTK